MSTRSKDTQDIFKNDCGDLHSDFFRMSLRNQQRKSMQLQNVYDFMPPWTEREDSLGIMCHTLLVSNTVHDLQLLCIFLQISRNTWCYVCTFYVVFVQITCLFSFNMHWQCCWLADRKGIQPVNILHRQSAKCLLCKTCLEQLISTPPLIVGTPLMYGHLVEPGWIFGK